MYSLSKFQIYKIYYIDISAYIVHMCICVYVWVNHTISPTWNKVVFGQLPLTNNDSSEVTVMSLSLIQIYCLWLSTNIWIIQSSWSRIRNNYSKIFPFWWLVLYILYVLCIVLCLYGLCVYVLCICNIYSVHV